MKTLFPESGGARTRCVSARGAGRAACRRQNRRGGEWEKLNFEKTTDLQLGEIVASEAIDSIPAAIEEAESAVERRIVG